MVKRPLPGANV